MRSLSLFAALSFVCASLGCVASADPGNEGESERDSESLSPGVNGDACAASTYNCKLRAQGGNRVATNDPKDDDVWHLATGGPVRDGNGAVVAIQSLGGSTFNFGQVRTFAGEPHALAVYSSNGSAAWIPFSAIEGRTSFEAKVGHVAAHMAGLAKMACYEIRDSSDPALEVKKVVYDSSEPPSGHERAGDYLPLVRHDGRRSANLTFNTPGFGLGGVAIDHFPAGTRFQRLDVPTHAGPPSIDVPLWVQDSSGRYRKQSGTMKFVYGYVVAADGTRRVGWMAYDALTPSGGCR